MAVPEPPAAVLDGLGGVPFWDARYGSRGDAVGDAGAAAAGGTAEPPKEVSENERKKQELQASRQASVLL